ncbi:MAG: hypothetical protein NTAFB05_25130 [Nitrobacter sp.]
MLESGDQHWLNPFVVPLSIAYMIPGMALIAQFRSLSGVLREVRSQMAVSEADAFKIIAAVNVGHRHALGITDDERPRAVPVDRSFV